MKYPPNAEQARITEIFSSFQGEGPRMGERHLFIRFEECHLNCDYCDEAGKSATEMSVNEVLKTVESLEASQGPHAYISLTGGEPLLYIQFLKPLCRELKAQKRRILLETNGILWQAYEEIARDCDLVSMDLKLSSVSREKDFLEEHAKFLKIAMAKDLYLKIVVSKQLDEHEFEKHLCMVAAIAPKVPVFLQPASRGEEAYHDPEIVELLKNLQRRGSIHVPNLRIGVQLHKLFNIR